MSLRAFIVASALVAALPLAPAAAQTAPRVGATVTDQQGGTVGTVIAVDGDMVVIRTDRHETQLPVDSFTVTDDAVLFDFNHPLAGQAVTFEVQLIGVL